MSIPTRGETFSKLLHHLGEAQSCAATLSHLHNLQDNGPDKVLAAGWFNVSEGLRQMQIKVTEFAKRGLQ